MAYPLDFARFEQLKTTGDLPSPKGVALAIMRATQAEDVSMAELGHIIRSDPAFSGRLIKAANGLQGYGRRPIASVQDALLILGLPAVRNLALGFSLLGEYRGGRCEAFDYERFWSGSVFAAVAMQKLAQRMRCAPADEAYCIGLLSRVGELALATLFPQQYAEVLRAVPQAGIERLEAEQGAFAMTHRELSAAMLLHWGVPRIFVEAVHDHVVAGESAREPGSREHRLLLSLVLARSIAEAGLEPGETRGRLLPALHELGRQLDLDIPDLTALCDEAASEWLEWSHLLQLPAERLESFASLALPPPAPATASSEVAGQEKIASPDTRLRVLVVDPDPAVRLALRHALEEAGHEVQEAERATEAGEIAVLARPHMLLIDWGHESSSGLDLVRQLRQTRVGRSIYVLLLTGQENDHRLIEAFEGGVDDFMTKPLNPRVLMARVRAGMRVVRLHEEIERDREEMRHVAAELAISNRRLQEVALSDPLTGFPNRRHLEDRMIQEWALAVRNDRPLAALSVDVDEFRLINETYGHDVGDAVLKSVALSLKNGLRTHDIVARVDGDEFVVLCPDTTLADAEFVADRVRALVEGATVNSGLLQLRVTVSVGVAAREPGMSDPELLLLRTAEARRGGHNQVSCVQERRFSEVDRAVRH